MKEFSSQRVVTFKDIDTVHERPAGTARKRFNDNRKRFVEGGDYFNLSATDSLMSEKRTLEIPNRGLTVFTEQGYLMLVKSFTDDLAWKVQRELVNTYFRAKNRSTDNPHEADIPTLIRCAEIMASCPEENKPYVLNVLRQIVPGIDGCVPGSRLKVKHLPNSDVAPTIKSRRPYVPRNGCYKPFDNQKFEQALQWSNISQKQLSDAIGCDHTSISKWKMGKSNPGTYYRKKICEALGLPEGCFDIV